MNDFFKSQLSTHSSALVDRIENFAGREIVVEVDTRPVSPSDPNPDRLAVEVDEKSAVLYIRAVDAFPHHGVVHELLHIERHWVEGIPQVLPLEDDANRLQITSHIENALEHQVIVPKEAEYGFEPFGYWNQTALRNWTQYPWPDVKDAWARRKNCLLGWLTVSTLVTDQSVKDHVKACLRQERLSDEAEKFATKIGKTIGSKPQAVGIVLRFLKIPVDEVELVKFDVVREKRISIPIPVY